MNDKQIQVSTNEANQVAGNLSDVVIVGSYGVGVETLGIESATDCNEKFIPIDAETKKNNSQKSLIKTKPSKQNLESLTLNFEDVRISKRNV